MSGLVGAMSVSDGAGASLPLVSVPVSVSLLLYAARFLRVPSARCCCFCLSCADFLGGDSSGIESSPAAAAATAAAMTARFWK